MRNESAEHKIGYEGEEMYYFCSAGCKEAFEQEPERYLRGMPERKDDMG